MILAEFIREQQHSCQGEVLEPIIEALSKYLVKELKDRDYAYIRWEYDEKKENVNERHAFVDRSRKVALCNWLREQGFHYRDAVCHLNGHITGIEVTL